MGKNFGRSLGLILVGSSTFGLIACGQKFQPLPTLAVNENSIDVVSGTSAGGAPGTSSGTATGSSQALAPTFCSQLSFSGVTWDQSLSLNSRRAFAIGLSISGGFEGGDGWANLTNNFDGTGMSAGLLNQTLGTGSLQPLLARMQSQHFSEFSASMTPAHYTSISSMLSSWEKSTSWTPSELLQLNSQISLSQIENPAALNPLSLAVNSESSASFVENVSKNREPASLDVNNALSGISNDLTLEQMSFQRMNPQSAITLQMFTPLEVGFTILSTATTNSISWATQNLYSLTGAFIPAWKTDMQTLLRKPSYVTIQINAALKYHLLAQKYMARVGYSDLRTYLLMFDIITQNGSISDARFAQWTNQIAAQKLTGEAARLKALVEVRLLDTLSQWRADVRSRKYAIIDGTGPVHGKNLNLTKQYCYGLSDAAQ